MQTKKKRIIYTTLFVILSPILASQLVSAYLSAPFYYGASASLDQPKSISSVKLLRVDKESLALEYCAEDFQLQEQWIDNRRFHFLSLPEAGYTSQVGYPQLPIKGVLVAIPPEAEAYLTILESSDVLFPGYNIPPVPQPITEPIEDEPQFSKYKYEEEPVIYSSNTFYPGKLAEIKFAGMLRDQHVVCVQFYPLRYNPVTKQLCFHQNIKVRIDWQLQDIASPQSRTKTLLLQDGAIHSNARRTTSEVFKPFEPIYKNTILNYDSARQWRSKPLPKERQFNPQMAPALAANSYKIYIRESGIYQLGYLDLKNAGLDVSSVDPRRIILTTRGREVRIHVHGEEDGIFDERDYIEFYGVVYADDYSPYNVYWLSMKETDGLRMEKKDTITNGAPYVPESFSDTVHEEKNELHWATFSDSEISDRFFWKRIFAPTTVDFDVNITHPVDTQENCTVRMMVRGNTKLDHHIRVYLNGQLLEDATWYGQTQHLTVVQTPQTFLKEGINKITIELLGDVADVDIIYLNWLAVDYHRQYLTDNDILKFSWQGSGVHNFQLEGFSQKDVSVYDITDAVNPIRIVNPKIEPTGEKHQVSFQDEENVAKTYLALTSAQKKKPVKIVKDIPSNLRSMDTPLPPFGRGEGSDYIIITYEDFYKNILPLVQLREQEGMRVKIVLVSDIYDEFNYGLPSDKAIRDFLKYAYHNWTPPAPFCVLLVGDASYDPKDYFGLGGNLVPTHLFNPPYLGDSASDTWFVAISGDDSLPDMIIGRLPVRTTAQAKALVEKIIDYEQYSIPGDWQSRVLLAADNEEIFEENCEQLASKIPPDYDVTKVYLSSIPPTSASHTITNTINEGCVLVDYVGHGGWATWAQKKIFQTKDIPLLNQTNMLPFVINMTCLTGFFHHPQKNDILSENLILADGKGCIATLTPAGASAPWWQNLFNELLFDSFFTHGYQRLGNAIMAAKVSLIANGVRVEDLGIYNLLGDAALKLALPEINIAWDVNGDGTVDILDLTIVASHYGEQITPFAHPNPDVNGDGIVDILDVVIICRHLGEEYGEILAAPYNFSGETATIWLELSEISEELVSIDVRIKSTNGLQGFQWNLNFAPSQLEVLQVTEGNFLNWDGETTYWHNPYIDSANGQIAGSTATRLTKHGVSGEGVLATILCRVNTANHDYFKNLRLADVKLAGISGLLKIFIDEPRLAFSRELNLHQVTSSPNPMKQQCYFTYSLTHEASTTIKIYTFSGRLIRTLTDNSDTAYNEVFWNGRDEAGFKVANGRYFYKMIADDGQGKVQKSGTLTVLR